MADDAAAAAASSSPAAHTFKLKLKLTAPLVQPPAKEQDGADSDAAAGDAGVLLAPVDDRPLAIGARGGAALKELLSTAPNPEEAIRGFQASHGLGTIATIAPSKKKKKKKRAAGHASFGAAEQLLDLLHVSRSRVYQSLLDKMLQELLLRIEELPQDELARMLEATFPYIEFRELRRIPIAILARQDETPEGFLRELTENRRILQELPVHVRRKIMLVDRQELQIFVEQCTQEYMEEQLEWCLKHPGQRVGPSTGSSSSSSSSSSAGAAIAAASSASLARSSSLPSSASLSANGHDLWNVSSHMPSPSARHPQSPWHAGPEERRRHSAALAALVEMIGDSEALYLSTLEILKDYVATASIPGAPMAAHAREYVDLVPFLGALRCDLANVQRDKTTALLRTDPLHKLIWFLDRAVKHHNTLDVAQLHELLSVVKRLRVADLPPTKKFKRSKSSSAPSGSGSGGAEMQDEEEHFEMVLGPPPVEQLLVVLDKIAKADNRMIFAEPVPDDVPGYRDVVKEPMDLSTMRKKARRGKYKSLEMVVDDFKLMIQNCLAFNADTTIFYKEGKRVGKRGEEILQRHAVALRGEPQRIRAKKRKKSGTTEAAAMLASSGVVTIKAYGDVDQTGMVLEGMCDDALADVALVLSDPHVKQMLCESLLKTLVACWQRRELPTDSLVCRGLVQLLQIGNPASVRRMLRKKDFVLRAPQVVTMRVVLPLVLRAMTTYRVMCPASLAPPVGSDSKLRDDLLDATLWDHLLRASSAIRSIAKALVLQSFKDGHAAAVELGAQLLRHLVAVEDDVLFRDRVFLHAVGEVLLQHVKAMAAASSAAHDGAASAVDALGKSSLWRCVVDEFLVAVLEARTRAAHEANGSILQLDDGDDAGDDAAPESGDRHANNNSGSAAPAVVRSFPVPVLHEKTATVLASAVQLLGKSGAHVEQRVAARYLRKTLGLTRRLCGSLAEFEALWQSAVFQSCRAAYDVALAACPAVRVEIFSAEGVATTAATTAAAREKEEQQQQQQPQDAQPVEAARADPEEDREAGEVDESE
ncbi:hypothetical protein ATCC90586_006381 [Pythium insidiosum]|nr:hypothetical protein ATCC90586_006381 [Pythium insidiosum]